ncbi:MAG: bifunctional aconitate hydratase 2/2-methylisocitrate dehydratase [Planctomycetota bacterium]|nr:bifunctional aconitate hydratase 2/2-methylisocitrate dehydratase [Planctomycetota bacterium]
MFDNYRRQATERLALGLPPLPLDPPVTQRVCDWLREGLTTPPDGQEDLLQLVSDRVPAGVDPAAAVKTDFLAALARGEFTVPGLTPVLALELLGAMLGGYNVLALLEFLDHPELAYQAVKSLSGCVLASNILPRLREMQAKGHPQVRRLLEAWADMEWFQAAPTLPAEIPLAIYKVEGEVNTDDLSPARHASTRPDIPLHALSMGESRFPEGVKYLAERQDGFPPAFAADTLGTGSSRKSAANSLVWFLGEDIPHIPNKRRGGVVLASRIAPIFYNSFEDAGGLPIQMDVAGIKTGDRVRLVLSPRQSRGEVLDLSGRSLSAFAFPEELADEWRAGGRLNLIIGRRLAREASDILGKKAVSLPARPEEGRGGYTLGQKLVGKACGRPGVRPGENLEPVISSLGSQDTTGPMTRDELKDLACLSFAAPLVLQSFCHTAAYPNQRDLAMQTSLSAFMRERGGLALKPGDGIIHSWLNRLILPDQVGTGGDSHTRFPLGISFPAGSGLVALGAAMGFMPLQMPESVRVSFRGHLAEGLGIRDVVNAIPLRARQMGLLDPPEAGNANVFNGRILEMEGLPGLTVDQGFELTCAAAERSAAAATIALDLAAVVEHVKSAVALIQSLIRDGYQDRVVLERRRDELSAWLERPSLLSRDPDAVFAATVDLDLTTLQEPVIACPNHPDQVELLSARAGEKVDEVFIGSCMSSLPHFRLAERLLHGPGAALAVRRLWVTVPTRMDHDILAQEGVIQSLAGLGARLEIPGCSLCMGNQARVEDGAVVFSTSTRNFANRMGADARVYLGSAALAAVVARLGYIPAPEEYFRLYQELVTPVERELSQPLYFHHLNQYKA